MTTQHDCGGPVFGRLDTTGGCPRCAELLAGAEPIRWAISRRESDEAFAARLRALLRGIRLVGVQAHE